MQKDRLLQLLCDEDRVRDINSKVVARTVGGWQTIEQVITGISVKKEIPNAGPFSKSAEEVFISLRCASDMEQFASAITVQELIDTLRSIDGDYAVYCEDNKDHLEVINAFDGAGADCRTDAMRTFFNDNIFNIWI